MQYNPQRYDAGTFLIYIDSYEKSVPAGRLYYPYQEETCRFRSLTELVLAVEQFLETEEAPQSFHVVRTFFPLTAFWPEEAEEGLKAGRIATFTLRILFRRNASWQGVVTWLEEKETERFRSTLELVFLMNSAIEKKRLESGGRFEEKKPKAKEA